MKTNATYYRVRLTESIGGNQELSRVMRGKYLTIDAAKGYARELLDLIADGMDGSCDKTTDLYLVTCQDSESGKKYLVCFAEIIDQDGKVQQI